MELKPIVFESIPLRPNCVSAPRRINFCVCTQNQPHSQIETVVIAEQHHNLKEPLQVETFGCDFVNSAIVHSEPSGRVLLRVTAAAAAAAACQDHETGFIELWKNDGLVALVCVSLVDSRGRVPTPNHLKLQQVLRWGSARIERQRQSSADCEKQQKSPHTLLYAPLTDALRHISLNEQLLQDLSASARQRRQEAAELHKLKERCQKLEHDNQLLSNSLERSHQGGEVGDLVNIMLSRTVAAEQVADLATSVSVLESSSEAPTAATEHRATEPEKMAPIHAGGICRFHSAEHISELLHRVSAAGLTAQDRLDASLQTFKQQTLKSNLQLEKSVQFVLDKLDDLLAYLRSRDYKQRHSLHAQSKSGLPYLMYKTQRRSRKVNDRQHSFVHQQVSDFSAEVLRLAQGTLGLSLKLCTNAHQKQHAALAIDSPNPWAHVIGDIQSVLNSLVQSLVESIQGPSCARHADCTAATAAAQVTYCHDSRPAHPAVSTASLFGALDIERVPPSGAVHETVEAVQEAVKVCLSHAHLRMPDDFNQKLVERVAAELFLAKQTNHLLLQRHKALLLRCMRLEQSLIASSDEGGGLKLCQALGTLKSKVETFLQKARLVDDIRSASTKLSELLGASCKPNQRSTRSKPLPPATCSENIVDDEAIASTTSLLRTSAEQLSAASSDIRQYLATIKASQGRSPQLLQVAQQIESIQPDPAYLLSPKGLDAQTQTQQEMPQSVLLKPKLASMSMQARTNLTTWPLAFRNAFNKFKHERQRVKKLRSLAASQLDQILTLQNLVQRLRFDSESVEVQERPQPDTDSEGCVLPYYQVSIGQRKASTPHVDQSRGARPVLVDAAVGDTPLGGDGSPTDGQSRAARPGRRLADCSGSDSLARNSFPAESSPLSQTGSSLRVHLRKSLVCAKANHTGYEACLNSLATPRTRHTLRRYFVSHRARVQKRLRCAFQTARLNLRHKSMTEQLCLLNAMESSCDPSPADQTSSKLFQQLCSFVAGFLLATESQKRLTSSSAGHMDLFS